MSEEKIRKARKEYICECCGEIIKKGELYIHGEYRSAKYSAYDDGEDDEQIGVYYNRYRVHTQCTGELLERLDESDFNNQSIDLTMEDL